MAELGEGPCHRPSSSSTPGVWPSGWPTSSRSRLGEEAVATHHGSLSRATRWDAEQKLKNGQVKVCVATASLELGIDIGEIDLVCQIGSPRSIGLLVQRVGRSGHTVGGVPKGKLFPLTRDEMLECAALSRALLQGNLDTFVIPSWPLDVMAQQMVAACASEDWDEDALFELCRRAYPYRNLPRDRFDQVVASLSQGFAPRLGRNGAHLHRDGVNHQLKGRRGARLAALTSGGAIPDNADYDVVADPDGTFVGTVNEDFAIESMAGDVFLLGNTPWKVRRVESGRVRVQDAQGNLPTIPFWLGEAPGRTWELSDEITQLREGIDRLLASPPDAEAWLASEAGVSPEVARQLVAYLVEGKRVLGVVPTASRVVAERFFRRERRYATGDPRSLRRGHQPGLGHGPAQAHLPRLRLRAPGHRHRRRIELLPGAQHGLPPGRRVQLPFAQHR